MRVAVYAIRSVGSWSIKVSCDLGVDLAWWGQKAEDSSCRLVILAENIPLGWGMKLEQMKLLDKGIDAWTTAQWSKTVREVLEDELQEESRMKSAVDYLRADSMWIWWAHGAGAEADAGDDGQNRNSGIGRSYDAVVGCSTVRHDINEARKAEKIRANMYVNGGRAERIREKMYVDGARETEKIREKMYVDGAKEAEKIRAKMHVNGARGAEKIRAKMHVDDSGEAEVLAGLLRGRSLLKSEVDGLLAEAAPTMADAWLAAAQLAYLRGQLAFGAGVAPAAPPRSGARWLQSRHRKILRCQRCGSVALGRTACASCGSAACAYCEACLAMGRSRACALLLRGAAHPAVRVRSTAGSSPTEAMGRWGLSAAQSAAAGAALRFLAKPPAGGEATGAAASSGTDAASARHDPSAIASVTPSARREPAGPDRFLLWAVTGAGKTEMIFPLLHAMLQAGGRVLVATPRRDVVLELAPRLARAFPDETVVTLYGGSQERWKPGMLTLATTHQLMRFYHAFDLVIIDEIDAFPYHNDPMLAYAAHHACKPKGKFVYLSATPPTPLQREAASGRLPHAKVPVRFHGHPLPVPVRLDMRSVAQCLSQQRIPDKLLRNLRHSIHRGAQCFLFVSRIRHIEPLVALMRRYLPQIHVEGTSSIDPQRAEKVLAFRDTQIRLLITTTILERGVTVPRSDVYILDADSGLFDEASLIQMAGRAGRSKDDPAGRVFLASPTWTKPQKRAISQITRMNRIARKGGYLSNQPSQVETSPIVIMKE